MGLKISVSGFTLKIYCKFKVSVRDLALRYNEVEARMLNNSQDYFKIPSPLSCIWSSSRLFVWFHQKFHLPSVVLFLCFHKISIHKASAKCAHPASKISGLLNFRRKKLNIRFSPQPSTPTLFARPSGSGNPLLALNSMQAACKMCSGGLKMQAVLAIRSNKILTSFACNLQQSKVPRTTSCFPNRGQHYLCLPSMLQRS